MLNSSNSSLTVVWAAPLGRVESYEVSVSGAELKTMTVFTNSAVIGNLTAGRVYNLTVTSVSGILKNISNILLAATSESEKLHTLSISSPEL